MIAESQTLGRDAAEKVKVDYEVLTAVSDPAKTASSPCSRDCETSAAH